MRQENPDAPFGELSRLIGLKWKALDPEEKKTYEDRAKVRFFKISNFYPNLGQSCRSDKSSRSETKRGRKTQKGIRNGN